MRFKVDENLPVEIAELLRRQGHEAHTVVDEGLSGATDQRLVEVLRQEARILVTLDVDFANIRRYPPFQFSGLVVLRLRNQGKRSSIDAMERVIGRLGDEAIEGRLWSVDESSIRVHD